MNKNKTYTKLIGSIICMLSLVAGISLYNDLPQQISLHKNLIGNNDSYMSKTFAVYGLPFLMVAINLIIQFIVERDTRQKSATKISLFITKWIFPILSATLIPYLLFNASENCIKISSLILMIIGLAITILGCYISSLVGYLCNIVGIIITVSALLEILYIGLVSLVLVIILLVMGKKKLFQ